MPRQIKTQAFVGWHPGPIVKGEGFDRKRQYPHQPKVRQLGKCAGKSAQRVVGSRSIAINVNDPGTGPLRAPAGTGPNFAETMNTR